MISEEIIIDRQSAEAIINTLSELLAVDRAIHQFKIQFARKENGEELLTITPHHLPIPITLRKGIGPCSKKTS